MVFLQITVTLICLGAGVLLGAKGEYWYGGSSFVLGSILAIAMIKRYWNKIEPNCCGVDYISGCASLDCPSLPEGTLECGGGDCGGADCGGADCGGCSP